MSREEAIICLQGLLENPLINKGSYLAQAIEMAIQALSQEPCDDAISREAAIQTLNKMDRYTANELTLCDTDKKFPANEVFIVDDVYEQIIEQLPPVTQKSGKWRIAHGWYEDRFWCSCGYIRIMDSRMNEWKYCPVCGGAKMVEPQESEGISERNMKMWEEIFKAESEGKG